MHNLSITLPAEDENHARGAIFMTCIDLAASYPQPLIARESRHLMTFYTPDGRFHQPICLLEGSMIDRDRLGNFLMAPVPKNRT
ncbi:hypothetical protein SARC_05292 [Sphaeroforma arctica JP610]|uniref:Uncharacterized protein n=1 Tax=Sphaeroforma arctica JP610 TaxID=667725 RepID=A0A0L0G0Q8_9EUKA|nr:hypothetical protein SARC_05292 [Sphaeroforma arctica JP610]KNC82421.1 hypothetical protein SARC_05292 [Sphaeroforma arctica JP610]|eukprot:XP_014156323.1 hypothetical protein SARC_05292 [Sphaeroforma arctica JP610]